MLVFGLRSISDDQLGWLMDSNPICHPSPAKKMKCLFLDYVQLLMIGQAIRVMKVDQNVKKWNVFQLGSSVVLVRVFCCFSLGLLLFQSGFSVCPPPPDGKVGNRVAKKFRFSDLRSTRFNPRTILFSFFITSWQCCSFVMGNVPIGSPYTFTIYSIQVMANLST